jgi:membrane protease YdiL (CAAX protease family)
VENKIPKRFFVVTFLWSWFFIGIIAILTSFDVSYISVVSFPLIVLGASGPIVGTFYSIRTLEGKGAFKTFLKSFLSIKFGWKVWITIILGFGGVNFIAWIIPEFLGEPRIPTLLPSIYIFPLYFLAMVFLGGGQEEIGWRGYILPILEKRFGLIIGSLILGIVWAVWHLPMWFIPGSAQIYTNFFAFTLMCIGNSYFFSWVIKASGNRLLSGLVAQGAANAFVPLFPVVLMEENADTTRYWIYTIMIFAIGIIIVIARTLKSRTVKQ